MKAETPDAMDDISQMVLDCEDRSERLSEWEAEFISDIAHHLQHGGSFTARQADKLEEIWDRVTS